MIMFRGLFKINSNVRTKDGHRGKIEGKRKDEVGPPRYSIRRKDGTLGLYEEIDLIPDTSGDDNFDFLVDNS